MSIIGKLFGLHEDAFCHFKSACFYRHIPKDKHVTERDGERFSGRSKANLGSQGSLGAPGEAPNRPNALGRPCDHNVLAF